MSLRFRKRSCLKMNGQRVIGGHLKPSSDLCVHIHTQVCPLAHMHIYSHMTTHRVVIVAAVSSYMTRTAICVC